ncbi:maleylpyruvate isomerase N-terminal domain-containing protein [Actinokineospora sp. PR83]|uniref:maleylpyruvate isomerase N-terminal domain-containing protein n=1 Tax=Actinokineospora sp. PR83 TaxID=2884908 RepID=UPI0035ABF82B
MRVDHAEGLTAFLAALGSFDRLCESLTDERALDRSRCHGWVVADVLAHVHLGLQELLLGMHHTTDAEPTVRKESQPPAQPQARLRRCPSRSTHPGTPPKLPAL